MDEPDHPHGQAELPATAGAWHDGALDPEHLRVIQDFLRSLPQSTPAPTVEEAEQFLVEQATTLRPAARSGRKRCTKRGQYQGVDDLTDERCVDGVTTNHLQQPHRQDDVGDQ